MHHIMPYSWSILLPSFFFLGNYYYCDLLENMTKGISSVQASTIVAKLAFSEKRRPKKAIAAVEVQSQCNIKFLTYKYRQP